jgi:hypothetical protein
VRSIPREQLKELLEVYVGKPEGLPDIDPDAQIEFIDEYFRAGAPELTPLFFLCNLALRALAPIMKRKPFSRLTLEEKQDLVNRISASRNPLMRGITYLLGLPVFMSYYRRYDVSVPLGFDPKALKEEANLRAVTRDRDLPPKKEGSP